jgi:aldehyde:ferredoxin oxidoreductase
MFGTWGRVLLVDLTTKKQEDLNVGEETYRMYFGGSGLAVKLFHDLMDARVNPMSEESMIGFFPGMLTGIGIPFANKCFIVGKSPVSKTWMDSNAGGDFGSSLKKAGYDGILFRGKSDKPVYFCLVNGIAELRDASKIWGKDTFETEDWIRGRDDKIKVACIGPAGEKEVAFSSVTCGRYRAAARGGLTAVMGRKKLKALAIKGDIKPPVYDSRRLLDLKHEYIKVFNKSDNPVIKSYHTFGTCAGVELLSETGEAPCKNWAGAGSVNFQDSYKLGPEYLYKYVKEKYSCRYCPVGCGGIISSCKSGEEAGVRKPEYETVISFGTLCLNADIERILEAEELCDRYGIDTISMGSVIAFAMECHENGLLDDSEIDLNWGDPDVITELIKKTAERKGIGDLLARGVKKASERIKGSTNFAIHAGGIELPMHDPRYEPTLAVSYKCSPVPGKRHLICSYLAELSSIPKLFPEETTGNTSNAPFEREERVAAVFNEYFEAVNSVGVCSFSLQMSTPPVVDWLNAVTGWNLTNRDFLQAGQRILTSMQLFNLKAGVKPNKITISKRAIGIPPLKIGPLAERSVEIEKLSREYYSVMGWNKDGVPKRKTLENLGIDISTTVS